MIHCKPWIHLGTKKVTDFTQVWLKQLCKWLVQKSQIPLGMKRVTDWVCHSFKRFIQNISILIIYLLFKLRQQTGQRKIGQKASNPTKQQYVSEPTAITHLCPLMIFYSATLCFVSKGEKPSIMTVSLIQRAFVESNWLRSAARWP